MKKSLLFVAALLVSAMSFAEDKTCTINATNAAAATPALGKGSYAPTKDAEAEIALDGVTFMMQDIMRPNNNTPTGYAGDQVLQIKKSAGHFINKSALNLVSLELIVLDEANVGVEAGTASDALSSITLSASDETIQLKTYAGGAVGDFTDVTYRKVVVDLAGKKFVKVSALSSAPAYVYSAVLKYGETATDIENVVEAPKTFKTIYNGQVVIVRDGVRYNTVGQIVE